MQIQKDLSFYNNILGEFTVKDIISLRIDFRDDTIQENSVIMTTMDAATIANITVNTVIMTNVGVANNMLCMI